MGDLHKDDLDNAPCGFLTFSDTGIISSINNTLVRLLKHGAKEDLIGKSIETLLTISGRIFYQTHFFPLVKLHGSADEIFFTFKTADGNTLPVMCNALRNEVEGAYINQCVLLPVKQRGKYEQELLDGRRQAEGYLDTLLNALPDILIRANKEGYLLDFKTGDETAAQTLRPLMGKSLELYWKDKTNIHHHFIQQAISDKQLLTYEYTSTTEEGELKIFEVRVKPTGNEEILMMLRDITARKKADDEREGLVKELRERYSEMMQFNHIVSHNLRAPVAHILGLYKIIETQTSEADKQQAITYIGEAAHNMDVLLRDLNEVLSARSGINEKVELFYISDVVEQVLGSLNTQIKESKTLIKVHIDDDAYNFLSIKSYIHSALYNLVSNAIKFRKADAASHISLKVSSYDGIKHLEIADNGLGIDVEKYRDDLFGLYKRFHPDYEGKGLGLYMTKAQIETLNGTISVDSAPGEGSTFTIKLKA